MALIECKDPVYDRQVDQVLKMLEDGMERAEIAEKLGYKNQMSLDNYMRRRNFSWDSREKNFVPAAERYSAKARNNLVQLHGTSKADLIISLFERGESDAKDIAKQAGFDTHIEMANYMKSKGYAWDSQQDNYIKIKTDNEVKTEDSINLDADSSLAEVVQTIIPLLKNIQLNNQTTSYQPSAENETAKSVPRYQVKGIYGTKAMRMSSGLDETIKCFSEEKNISQREIIEVALIEFFTKYGYKDKIDCILD